MRSRFKARKSSIRVTVRYHYVYVRGKRGGGGGIGNFLVVRIDT